MESDAAKAINETKSRMMGLDANSSVREASPRRVTWQGFMSVAIASAGVAFIVALLSPFGLRLWHALTCHGDAHGAFALANPRDELWGDALAKPLPLDQARFGEVVEASAVTVVGWRLGTVYRTVPVCEVPKGAQVREVARHGDDVVVEYYGLSDSDVYVYPRCASGQLFEAKDIIKFNKPA